MEGGLFLIGGVSKINNGRFWDKAREVWESTADDGRRFCWKMWEVLGADPVVQEMVDH